jgi:hypothetical protein
MGARAAKQPRKPGRPTKLTPELQRRLCALLRLGVPAERAARLVGIGERTFHTWMADGERQEDGPFQQFRQAVQGAQDSLVKRALSTVTDLMGPKNEPSTRFKAASFILTHCFAAEFSPRREVTGAKGGPVQLEAKVEATVQPVLSGEQLQGLSPETRQAVVRELMAQTPAPSSER